MYFVTYWKGGDMERRGVSPRRREMTVVTTKNRNERNLVSIYDHTGDRRGESRPIYPTL
jgi:hypothetical protein